MQIGIKSALLWNHADFIIEVLKYGSDLCFKSYHACNLLKIPEKWAFHVFFAWHLLIEHKRVFPLSKNILQ